MIAMALKTDSSDVRANVKVTGDIGELQITEVSDSDTETEEDKNNVTKGINTLSDLPTNLLNKSEVPIFGNVSVTKSENVQFGNNTYFNGPVTIKHVVHKSGIDNPAYEPVDQRNTGHINDNKFKDHSLKEDQSLGGHHNICILIFGIVCVTLLGGIIAIAFLQQNKNQEERKSSTSQPDFTSHNTTPLASVVGISYENIHVILSVTWFLITFLMIIYSLLTKKVTGFTRKTNVSHEIHERCVVESCTKTNVQASSLFIARDFVRIVSRDDWLAQPVEGELDKIKKPVPWVIIAHTATEGCYTQSQCILRVRLIQMFHIESRGWYDIGYNFLVGGDGSVYLGRGWDYEGAHTKYYNKYSMGIAFIGTFNNDPPPKQQVDACMKIINKGVQLGVIATDYKLFSHRQLMSTLSPGDKVVDIIKHWPHYVKNDTDINDLLPRRTLN